MTMRAKLPGASPSPGFEGVIKTIESCSAQTSSFEWNSIVQEVDPVIKQHFGCFSRPKLGKLGNPIDRQNLHNRGLVQSDSRFLDGLSTSILLAAMDYPYIV